MGAPSSPDRNIMARPPPAQLVFFFARALDTFQRSQASFSVLCSLPAPGEPAPVLPRQRPAPLLVLDSSFNPPTLAHKRMALSALTTDRTAPAPRVLLLLAINNADKAPKPATFPQRLALMYVFALDLLAEKNVGDGESDVVVDVAVTTEPYFHSKSGAIASCDFYRGQGETGDAQSMEQLYLTGYDTLIRVFDARYYPGNSMKNALGPFFARSRLRVTMRTHADWGTADDQATYLEGLRNGELEDRGGMKEWTDRVEMVQGRQGGDEVISSTRVREAVCNQDWEKLRTLVSDGVAEWVRRAGLYTEDAT